MESLDELSKTSHGKQSFMKHVFNFDEKLQIPQRLLGLLESLKGVNIGNLIDLFEHSIQTATR